ncbi:MAG: hypothetical protein DRI26_08125 [Chloroflexi bacterium]|nr:MAG: hypothetical protein DRI26_08125 [Chloroflexota bacterium]
METTLAILMALGIYLGIPLAIGFVIGGIFILSDRRAKRAERAKAATAEAEVGEPVKTPAEAGEVTR